MHTSLVPSAMALAISACIAACHPAVAQTLPDAGRILQELAVPPRPVAPSTDLQIQSGIEHVGTVPGGPRITLRGVHFDGMTRFDEETLRHVIRDGIGSAHDLASLHGLARQVTRFYRERGYPFARAYLPPQRMVDGDLRIEIIEGRLGTVTATGEAQLAAQAQPFMSALQPGEVIESRHLERVALTLGDLPGIVLSPVIKPGDEIGTGDFEARIRRGRAFEGRVGIDNHGNRYSGRHRALAAANWNSPFMLGDQLSASAVITDERLWIGQLAYSLPLGASGLRAQVGYTHTYYELGKEFTSLDATGTAKIVAAGLSYPLIRARQRNLILSMQYQHKELRDEYGAVNVINAKSSDSLPISLRFDARDGFGGGGVTYGVLTWTPGHLSLDSPDLRMQDRLTAGTAGGFQKLGFDIARQQRLQDSLTLFARFSGQLADKNLDSSESFSLGGTTGVRAYPQGEGVGDKGWLVQLELRYASGALAPYLFYDAGKVTNNVAPWTADRNHRSISGHGAGVRWARDGFSMDVALAWRSRGGAPVSDIQDTQPRLWLKVEYAL